MVEWNTMSAPNSKGRWKTGEAKVLSTISTADVRCAISAAARKSVTRISGFDGVSTKNSLVLGPQARSHSCTCVADTNVVLTPKRPK